MTEDQDHTDSVVDEAHSAIEVARYIALERGRGFRLGAVVFGVLGFVAGIAFGLALEAKPLDDVVPIECPPAPAPSVPVKVDPTTKTVDVDLRHVGADWMICMNRDVPASQWACGLFAEWSDRASARGGQ